ncbi:MAG: hypothetical protein ACOC3G_03130 [Phycisphaeraceae bacterium]
MNPTFVKNNRSRRRGLALVELILGLTITTMVGAAIATMLFAVSRGSSDENDLRALVARTKRVHASTTAALRGCRSVLDATDTRVIVWSRDSDEDMAIDATELRVIEYVAETAELRWYEPADSMPNQTHEATADFAAIVDGLMAAGHLDSRRWADGVTRFDLAFDQADASLAQLASLRVTLREGNHEHEAIAAVAMRNQ